MRIELVSNTASGEQDFRRIPALEELTETFAAWGVETRFTLQSHRQESEINLASGRHAKGVTVRGTSVRELTPETNIHGLLAWLRTVMLQPHRALHLHLENTRSTNGAALLFPRLAERGQRVFITGLSAQEQMRLCMAPDMTMQQMPKTMASHKALREEYLARATRATGFMASLRQLTEIRALPQALHAKAVTILEGRDSAALKTLSEAEVANIALLQEYAVRYEALVGQFTQMMCTETALGDLPNYFDLLTHGASLDMLRKAYAPFALEEKRNRIRDKRSLVNEVRLGLARAEGGDVTEFQQKLLGHVVRLRAHQDPGLYAKVVWVANVEPEEAEARRTPRRLFNDLRQALEEARAALASAGQEGAGAVAPMPLKERLFELGVSLNFQSKFNLQFRDGGQPPSVVVGRNLISCFLFDSFDMARIKNLHPSLPARGVAKNLSAKVPVHMEEVERIITNLAMSLYPLEETARALAKELQSSGEAMAAQKRLRHLTRFMEGTAGMLGSMHYVLGRSGQDTHLWNAAMAGGQNLGLSVLASRDQIRNPEARQALSEEEGLHLGGYQLLMTGDADTYFPLKSNPAHLARSYLHQLRERVLLATRRYFSNRDNYLKERHGARLFAHLHNHITWHYRLALSPAQLATLLETGGMFDAGKLKELGLGSIPPQVLEQGANPWLRAALEGDEASITGYFAAEKVQRDIQDVHGLLRGLLKGYGAPATGAEHPPLKAVLVAACADGFYDHGHPEWLERLAGTREAQGLSRMVAHVFAHQGQALLGEGSMEQALDLTLTGRLAHLCLLGREHHVRVANRPLKVRLKPGPSLPPEMLDAPSRLMMKHLGTLLKAPGLGQMVGEAVQTLEDFLATWDAFTQPAALALMDQALQQTVLNLIKPSPPSPKGLVDIPDVNILCLSTSSFDQAKFGKVLNRPESRESYATLSELASWLMGFRRLREELESYRGVLNDVLEVIAGLNLSTFDAPYMTELGGALLELSEALDVRPEEVTLADLGRIESLAAATHARMQEIFETERSVALADRWLGRVNLSLRRIHPNLRLGFIKQLFDDPQGEGGAEGEEGAAQGAGLTEGQEAPRKQGKDYQTFSVRVRNAVRIRERLEKKQVVVMSPNNTQKQLTLMLLEQIYRLKGVHLPVLVDISSCASFADDLHAHVPPHRLFDLTAI